MRMRVIVQTRADFDEWIRGQQRGPAQPWTGEVEELTATKFACTNCHVFDDSTKTSFGPNLTHLASRTTFAGGTLDLNRDNLVDWVLDAPSLVPMQSEDCRLPPPATCVGMPSFVDHTPPGGDYPVMTRAEAEEIADYLLAER
jgi:cytochrome c oxidase subunit 2